MKVIYTSWQGMKCEAHSLDVLVYTESDKHPEKLVQQNTDYRCCDKMRAWYSAA